MDLSNKDANLSGIETSFAEDDLPELIILSETREGADHALGPRHLPRYVGIIRASVSSSGEQPVAEKAEKELLLTPIMLVSTDDDLFHVQSMLREDALAQREVANRTPRRAFGPLSSERVRARRCRFLFW